MREQRWLLRRDRWVNVVLHWPHLNSPLSPMLSTTSSSSFRSRVPSCLLVMGFLPCSEPARVGRNAGSMHASELLLLLISCWALIFLTCRCVVGAKDPTEASWGSKLSRDDSLFCSQLGSDPLSAPMRSFCSPDDSLTRKLAWTATGRFTLDIFSEKSADAD